MLSHLNHDKSEYIHSKFINLITNWNWNQVLDDVLKINKWLINDQKITYESAADHCIL